jgi:lysophospholipase L1-like esterase
MENYRKNLKAIITNPLIVAHKPTILIVTPPPINEVHLQSEDLNKGYPSLTRTQSNTAQYAAIVRDIAAEFKDQNVVLVDLWSAMMEEATRLTADFTKGGALLGSLKKGDSAGLRHLLVDGLHLTGAGYKVFVDQVIPFIGTNWAEESINNPSWIFP